MLSGTPKTSITAIPDLTSAYERSAKKWMREGFDMFTKTGGRQARCWYLLPIKIQSQTEQFFLRASWRHHFDTEQ